MDEIEYKLNTNNSVLVVNAIDKLISTIKSKFKPAERQKFVVENEELKFLREKCSAKESLVSLTACQGLLALVELRVLEIAHTMSTVVTLLPTAHNYSAIISTMAGLLTLDLRARLVPGQPYRCQFSLCSPQHPFITVLERNKDAEDDVLAQMHALCTHPDYVVSSNSLELLRPVFLWMTSNPQRSSSLRPWQLLLSLPSSQAQGDLLLACISCQQINNPKLIEGALAAYTAVLDSAVYQQRHHLVQALLPVLARASTELVRHGKDPRACYTAVERGFGADGAGSGACAGLTVSVLADNLAASAAPHLHELFTLCLNILNKYEYSTLSLSTFTALSLQWLHLPSHLTASALKTASKILEIQQNSKPDSRLYLPNLKANKVFQTLLHTDCRLSVIFKMNQTWERIRDDAEKFKNWMDSFVSVDDVLKTELAPFFLGLIMERRPEEWYEDIVLKALQIVLSLIDFKKEISVQLLPILLYKIANDASPKIKMQCLKALPLMAKTKENVPMIVSILNKLKTNKGVPTSFLIMLYTSLAETQVRCFPYLQEILVDLGTYRPDDLKWEIEIARALSVKKICEIRATSHGLELVSTISSTLNRCTDRGGSLAAAAALGALAALWRAAAVAPAGAWRALRPRLPADQRPAVQLALCQLLSEIPALRAPTAEYSSLVQEACRTLWTLVCESPRPDVIEAACDALSGYKIDDYTLKDIPEIYRRTVKLPASYCKTPADAARNPEDVLDYIPCEVWPEVFRCTNLAAVSGVSRWARRLAEREARAYRGGVYAQARSEPDTADYLPPSSVIRGLLQCLRKQIITPSYDFPDAALLAIVDALCIDSRPLPPASLAWAAAARARGGAWRGGAALAARGCGGGAALAARGCGGGAALAARGCGGGAALAARGCGGGVALAARGCGASGRRLVADWLREIEEGKVEEDEILQMFELLPILCRNMPPNSLRSPIERCLHESYQDTLKYKPRQGNKNSNDPPPDLLFAKQMELIKACLECDKIHDANRTLLSQIVENYFNIIEDDNVAWPSFVDTCCALATPFIERMTSPSSWWEVTAAALRRAARARAALARAGDLIWLNDVIDAQAGEITGQEYSLRCMLPALQAANPDAEATREWLLQLMARTQAAFKESAEDSPKLYLCDVFTLSVISFSGLWCCETDDLVAGGRGLRAALMPPALASLCARPVWKDCVPQMLDWLCHTRDAVPPLARACHRSALGLRHAPAFAQPRVWTRLETYFSRNISVED